MQSKLLCLSEGQNYKLKYNSDIDYQDTVNMWPQSAFRYLELVRAVTELANRPMPDTPDGTWASAAEWGDLIQLIDGMLQRELGGDHHEN